MVFFLFVLFQYQLSAWSSAIKIAEAAGVVHKKPVVGFAPDGKIFVVYEAGGKIHLSSYDGTNVAYEKKISESTLLGYEASIGINKSGYIHIVWIEAASYGANTQYMKYRFYNGSSWSAVSVLQTLDIPGTLPGGFVTRKVEDLRMDVDENNNVFIAFMVWPAARCQFISKYGSLIRMEGWPMTGRSKHPDVAVDANAVHVTWQQMWGSDYTIAYCKRANTSSARWQTVIDVRDGAHRPRIAVDPKGVAHVFQMDDYEKARMTIYKYWTGSGFSPKFYVSDDGPRLYNNIGIAVFDSNNIFTMELTTVQIFYNWKQNGEWTGHKLVEKVRPKPDGTTTALSPDGKTAAIVYTDREESVYMNLSTEGNTPPPPNVPPVASFNYSPRNGHYPLKVSFNARESKDSDGQIVSYVWDFGDGTAGQGVIATHSYLRQGFFTSKLTVTDNGGASASFSQAVEVFPANVPPAALFSYSPDKGHFPLSVSFNAKDARDNDGEIVRYSWDFGDGTFGQGMAAKHIYTINGFRKITLTVTDDDGAVNKKSSIVEVFAPNVAPVALFSYSPAKGHFPLSVSFSAKDSRDNDGQIVTYRWDFGDGTFGQGLAAMHTYTSYGFRKITLTVTDDDGAANKKSSIVEVFTPNVPPVGLFSITPPSGLYPLSVTFNAENSRDADGTIVSYRWDFGDGTFGSGKQVGHYYAQKKIYLISLTVTDDDGAASKKTGQVEVFGLFPPLNVQYRRETNRNLFSIEYLYVITWSSNPNNVANGARIVAYKIYRGTKGLANYSLFFTMPAGNQDPYEYLDRTLGSAPLEYEYKIRALDSAGRESD